MKTKTSESATSHKEDHVTPKSWPWTLALFGLAFAIRLIYALQVPFPPLDDPAYYVQGARSLRTGQPFDMAIVWNYHPLPKTVQHPGFDFWMPLTSFAIWLSFGLFGDNPLAAQLPGVLAGSILSVLTFYLARRWKLPVLLAGLAGLYIAINPVLAYQSAVPDSQMLYAALVGAAWLVWPVGNGGKWFRYAGLGALIGLAYLTRSHAVFLGLAWAGVTLGQLWRQKDRRRATLLEAGLVMVGLGVVIGPWLARTWLTFGFINSPAGLESALIYDYASLFNYQTPINFSSFAALGPGKILAARGVALYNAWVDVLSVIFLPTVILPLAGLILLWWRQRAGGGVLLYWFLLSLGLPLIFVAASSTGSFYHSSGSLAAAGAIGYLYLGWLVELSWRARRPRSLSLLPLMAGALFVLELAQFVITVPQTISRHQDDQNLYQRLGVWLKTNDPGGQAVIADEPSSLNYATGLPALRLPSDEPLEILQNLANQYQVRYIVVTGNFGRYPALLDSPNNTIFPRLYADPQGEFEVFDARGNQP